MVKGFKKVLQAFDPTSSSSQAKKRGISYPTTVHSTHATHAVPVEETTFESPRLPPGVPESTSSPSMGDFSHPKMDKQAFMRQSTFENPRTPPAIPGQASSSRIHRDNKSKDKATRKPLPQSDMAGRSGTGTFETPRTPLAVSNTDPVDVNGLSDHQNRQSLQPMSVTFATNSFVPDNYILLPEVDDLARSGSQMNPSPGEHYPYWHHSSTESQCTGDRRTQRNQCLELLETVLQDWSDFDPGYSRVTVQGNFLSEGSLVPDEQAPWDDGTVQHDAHQQSLATQAPPYVPSDSQEFRDNFETTLEAKYGSQR